MFMASKLCSVAANFPGKLECCFPDFVRYSCDFRRINVYGIHCVVVFCVLVEQPKREIIIINLEIIVRHDTVHSFVFDEVNLVATAHCLDQFDQFDHNVTSVHTIIMQ